MNLKNIETQQELTFEIINLLGHDTLENLQIEENIKEIIKLIKKTGDFHAVGIRLKEMEDYPYYETLGFSDDFIKSEKYLCNYDPQKRIKRDTTGRPILECLCGNILSGFANPKISYFTQGGSFWTNSTSKLISEKGADSLQIPSRNRCNKEGYESVALIPIHIEKNIIGLLQLNDMRPNRFSLEMVEFLEKLCMVIAIGIGRKNLKKTIVSNISKHEENLIHDNSFTRNIIEALTHPFYIIDAMDYSIIISNSAAGFSGSSELKTCYSMTHNRMSPCDGSEHICPLIEVKKTKKPVIVEHTHFNKAGEARIMEVHGYPHFDKNGNVIEMIEYSFDITDRKIAEAKIRESMQEKEVMLKEIHHRVKNNLAVISSLLSMQARQAKEKEAKIMLEESKNRIRTMALIHENLYQTDNFTKISMPRYISNLIDNLKGSYLAVSGRVKMHLDIDPISFGIEKAIPCSLLINEVVSNSFKYAFPEPQNGEIFISLKEVESKKYFLDIKDNGVGLPPDYKIDKAKSLGISLIKALSEQLKADMKIKTEAGLGFELSFCDLK